MFCPSLSAEIIELSFKIAHMIAKEKKTHNIGETLIKLYMLKAAGLCGGKDIQEDGEDLTLGFYDQSTN